MVSDGGSNLLSSKEFKSFLAFYGIQGHVTSPNVAKTHGTIEASNRRISELLRILSAQHKVAWPNILPYVCLNLNSSSYAHLENLSPFEVMFGFPSTRMLEKLELSRPYISISDQQTIFQNLNDRLKIIVAEGEKERLRDNASRNPSKTVKLYKADDLIYTKDFSLTPHKKHKSRFLSVPLVVLRDYGQVVLAQNHLGQSRRIHKDNIRPCPTRDFDLFDRLPLVVKGALGYPFDPLTVANLIKQGLIPDFWLQFGTVGIYDRPHTRSQGHVAEDPVLDPDLFSGHYDDDSSDDDDESDDDIANPSLPLPAMTRYRVPKKDRTVTFNI